MYTASSCYKQPYERPEITIFWSRHQSLLINLSVEADIEDFEEGEDL